jgi:hypothetical protein
VERTLVGTAESRGKGVGRVTKGDVRREREEARDHERNLQLFRAAEASDLRLDGRGGEGVDWQTGLGAGEENDSAHVAKDEGRVRVHGMEQVLDGQGVRVEPGQECLQTGVDEA